jgi:multidrug resistance efflux pump
MMRWSKTLMLPGLATAMLLLAVYHLLTAGETLPDLPPPALPAQTLALRRISGTGLVEPETESISLGTAQSGLVLEVPYNATRVGERVKRGDMLFRVDDRAWLAQRAIRAADLAAAEAELARLRQQPRPEDVPPLEARVAAATARMSEIEDRLKRAESMPAAAISREEVTQRRFLFEAARHDRDQAARELDRLKAGAWQADLAVAQAQVEAARANLELVETEIERCLVRAPVDAEILQVNVRAGEYVSGNSARSLMVLGNLQKLHVRVEIDEEDIPRFTSGQRAVAITRGNSAQRYPLKFVRVEPFVIPKRSLSGLGSERVDTRVLQIIYEVATTSEQLFVGQQVDVFIELGEESETSELTRKERDA